MVNKSPYSIEQHKMHDLQAEIDFKQKTNQKLQGLQSSVTEMNKSLCDCIASQKDHRTACSSEHIRISECVKSQLSSFSDGMREQKKIMNEQALELKQQLAMIVDHDKKVLELCTSLSSIKELIHTMQPEIEKLRQELAVNMYQFTTSLENTLKDFKQEILSRPDELPTLKKQFQEKIDLVALDGTNSVLRTSNCEKQLQLIEKKIEHIYLLIKKLDLHKQES